MRSRFLYLLIPILLFVSCKQEIVPEPYKPRTGHEAYMYALQKANLLETALGQDWQLSADMSLTNPIPVTLPFKEAFYLDPAKAEALSYRFSVKQGQKIEVDVTILDSDPILMFIDLFRINNDSLNIWKQVASADSLEHNLAFEPRMDADYILRLQPELLRGGRFGIKITKIASFDFPVTGKNSKAIGSYFGDPRDGGKREHHGVDIFAKRHTPVIAPTKAYVRRVGERGLGGNVIWLRDSKGYNLYFAHLQDQLVESRTYVNPGDTIGTVGNTGNARTTPTHLHFGLYKNGPIDPIHFIKETNTVFPEISSDLHLLGHWVRSTKTTLLKPLKGKPSTIMDTLFLHEPVRVVGAKGSSLRVILPTGVVGYVDGSEMEDVGKPISTQNFSDSYKLLHAPVEGAFTKNNLINGDSISVIGQYNQYWFVRTSLGHLGWIRFNN